MWLDWQAHIPLRLARRFGAFFNKLLAGALPPGKGNAGSRRAPERRLAEQTPGGRRGMREKVLESRGTAARLCRPQNGAGRPETLQHFIADCDFSASLQAVHSSTASVLGQMFQIHSSAVGSPGPPAAPRRGVAYGLGAASALLPTRGSARGEGRREAFSAEPIVRAAPRVFLETVGPPLRALEARIESTHEAS